MPTPLRNRERQRPDPGPNLHFGLSVWHYKNILTVEGRSRLYRAVVE